jgi:regulator of protease activity HflC (stomatin/prohibitin superfamily)
MNASHRESAAASANGYLMFVVGLALALGGAGLAVNSGAAGAFGPLAAGVLLLLCGILVFAGLYMLQPNEAAILMLFGAYSGTDRHAGLRWANPLKTKRKLSLRARNLNVQTLKVNDKRGNPVEIGAVVVWRVKDSAQAVFDVDNYELFVSLQAEAAVRHLASLYAYDDGDDLAPGETTLRAGQDEVAAAMRRELGERFAPAGVEVLDAKLTHLAYAPEIAQVMLRRQQAEAVISARQKIVHGAVSMVETALTGLSERHIVELDDERKAAMVSNLLVVLCSDRETQPIVNAGTLYN